MLNKLLALIQEGRSLTPLALAKQLDTSPMMVEMMIEELTRRGLLKVTEFQENCETDACGTCYLAKTCHSHSQSQRIWTTSSPAKAKK